MSSRIEKGGARFKPSIVPRRNAAAPTPQTPLQHPNIISSAPSTSPFFTQQAQARPLSVRSAISATIPSGAASSPSAITPAKSQSYAFNVSPSVLSHAGPSTTAPNNTALAGSSAVKPKFAFNRPAVSKPRPGSRASLTPAPQLSNTSVSPSAPSPAAQASSTLTEDNLGEIELTSTSTRSMAPPTIGGSRGLRHDNTQTIRGGAERATDAAFDLATDAFIDKASQPDPFQEPQRPRRTRGADNPHTEALAAAKQSASQQEAIAQFMSANPDASAPNAKQNTTSAATNKKGKEEQAARAAQRRLHAAARLQKRRLKRKELSSGKPRRPLSAYLLFVNSVRAQRQKQNPDMTLTQLTSEIAAEWRDLVPAQRTKWETEASLLRQQYDSALETWKLAHPDGVALGPEDESDMETTSELDEAGDPIRRKKRRINLLRKPHTVSDDEEEYRRQVYHEGEQLAASRVDPANITMGEISTLDYKKGRAGPRTFEAERVYTRLVTDRRAAAKSALLGQHVLAEKANHLSPSPAPPARIVSTTNGARVQVDGEEEVLEGEEEEIVGDETGDDDGESEIERSAPESDADGTTNGEAGASSSSRNRKKREASVAATDISFNENRFAVQTRIVDGKIVIDETSLFANYGNGEEDRENMEVVDEREGDRFVNAATYSRKMGRNRKWTADDTAKFYRSLQQWGTDFEMIARLFPGRDRVMIKKKFNVEERSNGKLIDAALMNSVPVNLEQYAQAIGVDLSGPPPEIKADLGDIEALNTATSGGAVEAAGIKKREGTAPIKGSRSDVEDNDDGDDWYEYEEVIEVDDQGVEQVLRRRLGKKAGAKGKRKRNSARKNSMSTPAPAVATNTEANAVEGEAGESGGAAGEGAGERAGGPPLIGTKKSNSVSDRRSTRGKRGDSS
uniref:-related protein n=1 Tax=Melanopsichium pennsylvanicum 4 TaxID=1398559 RepID=A0A077QYD9_9BASI|nr:-related protein [Melanopsichium pennsylvanicum 4]